MAASASPLSGGHAGRPPERPAECRLGFIADIEGDRQDAFLASDEASGRQSHAPAGQVLDRGQADEVGEARGQGGPGRSDAVGEGSDGPALRRARVEQRERAPHRPVAQPGKPAAFVGRQAVEVAPHQIHEHHFAQAPQQVPDRTT